VSRPKTEILEEKYRRMRWRMKRAKCRCGRIAGHQGAHRGPRALGCAPDAAKGARV
jgi:hypothetical protein